ERILADDRHRLDVAVGLVIPAALAGGRRVGERCAAGAALGGVQPVATEGDVQNIVLGMAVPGRNLPATSAERGQSRLGAAVADRELPADVAPPADGVDDDVAHLPIG